MSDSNSVLESILKSVVTRDGQGPADTMLVNAHLSQMRMFGIRQGVEFYPEQDNFGTQRFDFVQQVIKFNKLDQISIRKIVEKFVVEMNDLLSDKQIKILLSPSATDYIISQGYDNKMGARPLARKINELIKVPLSKRILFENIKACTIKVDYTDKIEFDIKDSEFVLYNSSPNMIDENGYIVLDQLKSNS